MKFCDLCGAPVILVKEPDDNAMEHKEEDEIAPDEETVPEQEDEENPGPGTDEVPEEEQTLVPEKTVKPHPHTGEIREPDTEELLELYGREYDPDETIESSRTPKSRSSRKQEEKKPGRNFKPSERVSSEVVDDALFLSPGKPKKPAKPRQNPIHIIGGGIVLVFIIAVVYFIGLPMLAESPDTQSSVTIIEDTSIPGPAITKTTTSAVTATPTRVAGALVPLPTQTNPTGQKLYFTIQKSPITAKILVMFAGSAGHGSIKSADIRVTHPDGTVATGVILPLKGVTEIILDGSKGTDRVEIIALMSDDTSYRVRDELLPAIE
jgi:hypothetical protein